MAKRMWLIEGFDGTECVYSRKVLAGCFTENQIHEVLRALAAKAALGFDEIVGAYAKRGTKIANDHLTVHRDGVDAIFSCGVNPHFHARTIEADDV